MARSIVSGETGWQLVKIRSIDICSALSFILQHSVNLVKFNHNAFKFIDKCVNFQFTADI